ncbi:MAG: efflux RND transporter periplasmic adaptor subunit [Pseudomonadota bacterium]|nr:efflux RND transporter periplasmic adaptor subunit [Pseudomonadota bacterium]
MAGMSALAAIIYGIASRAKRMTGPAVVVLITALIVTTLYRNKPEPKVGEAAVNRIGVYVERAIRTGARAEVTVYGEVRPRVQIDVISEVSGRVTSVSPHFIEGGSISAGDALLTIEDRDYVLAVSEARARLAARRLELAQALADADVAKRQLAGEVNPSDLALKKPQIAQARAGVQAGELSLSRAESDLSRTQISLPFDARITDTMADEGQYVGAGRTVASVFSTDVAEVRLPLTDADIAALGVPIGYEADEGAGLRVKLSTDIAGVTRKWAGRLVRLDASLDPQTRSTFGTVEVANPFDVADGDMPMAPGLFVAAEIEGRRLADVLAIPTAGLRAGGRVFIMNDDDLLEVRSVIVAHATTSVAYLSSGVNEGDRIIVSPIRNPVAGMALSAIEEPAEPVQLSAG